LLFIAKMFKNVKILVKTSHLQRQIDSQFEQKNPLKKREIERQKIS